MNSTPNLIADPAGTEGTPQTSYQSDVYASSINHSLQEHNAWEVLVRGVSYVDPLLCARKWWWLVWKERRLIYEKKTYVTEDLLSESKWRMG